MSITVVVRRVAEPGQEAVLVPAMVTALGPTYASHRQQASVFQSDHDPARGLYVANYDSRVAYENRVNPGLMEIDRLCARVERCFYQSIHLYEQVLVPGPFLTSTEFTVPVATAEAVLAYLLQTSRPAIHRLPGCVLSILYRDLDAPERLFAIHRWRSEADRAAFDALAGPLGQPLLDWGVHIERFRGQVRADADA
jgi:Antibiotic biosynthesis monooxygenase